MNVNTVLLTSVVAKMDHSEIPFRLYDSERYLVLGNIRKEASCASDENYVKFSTQLQCTLHNA